MKHIIRIITFLSLIASSSLWALLPPAYLSVPYWKECTETEIKGSAQFICLPLTRLKHCPRTSWNILTQYHLIPPCTHN